MNQPAFPSPVLSHRIKRLAHIDLAGAGQIVVKGSYAYVGHMKPPHGTSILDISDPRRPRVVGEIKLEGELSHSHKVRVNGDVMITNVEQNNRHMALRGRRLAGVTQELTQRLGRAPNPPELARALHVNESDLPQIERFSTAAPYDAGGFRVWDVSDRSKPRLLAYHKTSGIGVHRFDADASFAYISSEMEGYVGNILVIYDMRNPRRPEEVSRWWLPGQHTAAGEKPTWSGLNNRLHHALRFGERLWAGCWQAGLRVIDVSNIRSPLTVGEYNYHPPVREPTHTVMPLPFDVDGRRLAVVVDEEHSHARGQLPAGLWVFDVTDLANMQPLGQYQMSELDSPWSRTPGARFGAHQPRERMDDTLVYCTWFSGGLRVIDVKDPFVPEEAAWFIPEPCGGFAAPQSNDVDLDERGLIYLVDRNCGFDVLELER
ncbi:MAG TPA: hypothetical protein VED01_05460 [Burkholderiales bacterium]|nr:hypothetical protein [Burkholderiales bacterium]